MSKTKTGEIENTANARVLRNDELDVVSGGRVTMEDIIVTSVWGGGIVVTKPTDCPSTP